MANQSRETREYNRVSADMQATVLAYRDSNPTAGYAEIAEYTGYPERTVKYILVDLPRLRRVHAGEDKAQGSLKGRIYTAVQTLGHIDNVQEVRRIVGMADSEHDVMHVLHSLHTQGRIDFDERGNGMGTATVVNIRLPKKGKPMRVISRQEEEQEISARKLPEETAAPEPESEEYPLLDALIEREGKRLSEDSKAFKYLEAAEAIRDIDPEAYSMLVTKAESNIPFPSPIEAEYLRYVATHPNKENA